MAGEVIEVRHGARGSGFLDALAVGVVDIGSGGAVVHRGDAVLGVVIITRRLFAFVFKDDAGQVWGF